LLGGGDAGGLPAEFPPFIGCNFGASVGPENSF
jgi:hypothetical protein